jgi:hypothetical protein
MPRPGEAPAPVFTGLPYGENALMNQMSEAIPEDDPFDDGFDELAGFEPGDDKTAFLFSETDRPDEPLTAGMPFGQGPNASTAALRGETKPQFATRIARTLGAESEITPGLSKFLDAVERGL